MLLQLASVCTCRVPAGELCSFRGKYCNACHHESSTRLLPLYLGIVLLLFEDARAGLGAADIAVKASAARKERARESAKSSDRVLRRLTYEKSLRVKHAFSRQKPRSAADPLCFGSDSLRPIHAAFPECDSCQSICLEMLQLLHTEQQSSKWEDQNRMCCVSQHPYAHVEVQLLGYALHVASSAMHATRSLPALKQQTYAFPCFTAVLRSDHHGGLLMSKLNG